jgi:hypothetical protein
MRARSAWRLLVLGQPAHPCAACGRRLGVLVENTAQGECSLWRSRVTGGGGGGYSSSAASERPRRRRRSSKPSRDAVSRARGRNDTKPNHPRPRRRPRCHACNSPRRHHEGARGNAGGAVAQAQGSLSRSLPLLHPVRRVGTFHSRYLAVKTPVDDSQYVQYGPQPISRVLVAHVTNLTPPGSECNPTCAGAPAPASSSASRGCSSPGCRAPPCCSGTKLNLKSIFETRFFTL